MFGHRPRLKSTAQMIAELDGLRRAGWRGSAFFVDDNFIGNKRVLKEELLPALIRWQQSGRGTLRMSSTLTNRPPKRAPGINIRRMMFARPRAMPAEIAFQISACCGNNSDSKAASTVQKLRS